MLWVADITYVPTWAGFLYLAVVLDAFSRRIVGWAMANHLKTELVLEALNMAVASAGRTTSSITRIRAAQYTSIAFGSRCREAGVRPSMGSVGDCYDNAMCERFFATLECELLDASAVPEPDRGANRGVRLHRGLVQHAPSPQRDSVDHRAGRVRAAPSSTRRRAAARLPTGRARLGCETRRRPRAACG